MIPHSQPWISDAEKSSVDRVMETAMLSRAGVLEAVEKKMANYLNKKFSLFTGNGSQAQALILAGLGIGAGDEVVVPSYVCDKVYTAVLAIGATPVVCDIGENWLVNPEEVAKKINKKTAAVVIPHVNGLNAWNNAFLDFGIPIVEDVCQSFGHLQINYRTGTYTDFAFTSFHGTKCIGAGEGGMLFLNDEETYQRILKIKSKNPLFTTGTDLVASVVLATFERYETLLNRRREVAQHYHEQIPQYLNADFISMAERPMNYRYLLRSRKDFKAVRQEFFDLGIHVRQGVDSLIHRGLGMRDMGFTNSVECFNTTVSIPALPQLTETQQQAVIDAVRRIYSR